MARFGWIAVGNLVVAVFVIFMIEWSRQELAVIKYWTDKQREAYRQRKRTGK